MLCRIALSLGPVLVCLPSAAGEREEAVREAAREGVDPNPKTRYGASALACARDRGNLDGVNQLIANGAEVDAEDAFDRFTRDWLRAVQRCGCHRNGPPISLMKSARNGETAHHAP